LDLSPFPSPGTERERRFASIALTLQNSYRNPANHEGDNFRCTWNEARFFIAEICTLPEISDIMAKPK
jgi:hypothetical protein